MPLRYAEPADEFYRTPLTISHILDGVLAKAADQEIIYRDTVKLTYRDLFDRIGRLAGALEALGARQGMTIAVLDWDSHRYLGAYFAVPMMGAVLQTVNVRLPAAQIAYTMQHADAEILLVHRDFFPLVEAILPQLPQVKAVIGIQDGVEEPLPAWVCGEYEKLLEAASPDFSFEDFDEDALATIFYTSGTTGNPKGVSFTHRQLVLHTLVSCGPFGATQASASIAVDDVYMPLTPMFHVHAWGIPYVATMMGLKQVYPGRYEPELICRLRSEHKVNYSHCVPTVLEMVLTAAQQTGADLSGWKMTIGGSALTKALCATAISRGMTLVAGYGMSETAPIVAKAVRRFEDQFESEQDELKAMVMAGVTVPLVEARVVNGHLEDVAHDGVARGELVLRAPWLTPSYVNNADASRELWRGGWLHTQDIATMDARGHIEIRDRLKDVIKTGGEWIDSVQLEELVATADGVREASVIAVPDDKWGERPLAVVVLNSGKKGSLDDINRPVVDAIAAGTITRFAKLERFEVIDALPKTSVGKIDKKALRQLFAGNASGSPSDGHSPGR